MKRSLYIMRVTMRETSGSTSGRIFSTGGGGPLKRALMTATASSPS